MSHDDWGRETHKDLSPPKRAKQKSSARPASYGTWQPIETAPKDGSYVLVSNGRGVWVARHKAVYQSGWKPANPWQSMMLNHDHIPRTKRKGRPTYWMPIPAQPIGAGVFGG